MAYVCGGRTTERMKHTDAYKRHRILINEYLFVYANIKHMTSEMFFIKQLCTFVLPYTILSHFI